MITYPVAVAASVLAVTLVVSGVALLRLRRARAAAVLLVVAGLGLLLTCALAAGGMDDDVVATLLAAVSLLVAPLAVAAYPRPSWRAPVELVAIVTLVVAGVVATVGATSAGVVESMVIVVLLTLVGLVWWRLEHAGTGDRWSLTWLALGLGTSVLTSGIVVFAAPPDWGGVVATALFCLVGPCLYMGVAHPEAVDVRGVVVQVVVFLTAGVTYLALFVGAAAFLEILGGTPPAIGLLGILGALLAATFQPTRVVLRGVIDELLFGERPDPLGAAGAVAGRLADDPVLALRSIRQALVLPYVALRIDGEQVAESGVDVTHTRVVPLALPGRPALGELVVGLRPGDLALSPDDEHVLALVAPLLAQTLRARALAADLQASREEAITAIEEERRRLRRDLHDGMGPRLSGIAFLSDAALNSVRRDPAAAERLLGTLRAETVQAIDDIRGLVYGMRPPALDELGLVPAIEQHAAALRTPAGSHVHVTVAADDLPPLTAAEEVATYRIVVEALLNVARHSRAATASVSLRHDADGVVVEVQDDGGPSPAWSHGVGIASMRERAAALGGSLDAGSTSAGGRIIARLPSRLRDGGTDPGARASGD